MPKYIQKITLNKTKNIQKLPKTHSITTKRKKVKKIMKKLKKKKGFDYEPFPLQRLTN